MLSLFAGFACFLKNNRMAVVIPCAVLTGNLL